jgi:hypothetical protein
VRRKLLPDLTGRRFYRLEVVSRDLSKSNKYYNVFCDCGASKSVLGSNLLAGLVKSCGCLRTERLIEYQKKQAQKAKQRRDEIREIGLKHCPACSKDLPLACYTIRASRSNSLYTLCKGCLRDKTLLSEYGITFADKEQIIAKQRGFCANTGCKTLLTDSKKTHLDHCHRTKKIRGVLCSACNMSLGRLKESTSRIVGLAEYISKNSTVFVSNRN